MRLVRLVWSVAVCADAACEGARDVAPRTASPGAPDASAPAAAPRAFSRLSLERTDCRSLCPTYSVEVTDDGTVTYEGRRCVLVRGRATRTLSAEDMQRLQVAVDRAAVPSLPRPCCDCGDTDSPEAIVTLVVGQGRWVIRDMQTCAPFSKELRELSQEIDLVTGTAAWIGTREQGLRNCVP